jgi:hypothetical protein
MKITRRKRAANQRNAQKSTGPKSVEGKAAVARNATSHGLSAGFTVLPHEDQVAFNRMLENYCKEFNPQTEHSRFLVHQLAQSRWRLERIRRFEAIAFELMLEDETVLVQLGTQTSPSLSAAESGAPDSRWATNPDARIVAKIATKTGDPLPILHRYAVEAERSYYRAHRELSQGESRATRNKANEAQVWLKEQLQLIPLPPVPDFDSLMTGRSGASPSQQRHPGFPKASGQAVPGSWSPNPGQNTTSVLK